MVDQMLGNGIYVSTVQGNVYVITLIQGLQNTEILFKLSLS
jgi:hypothetical protein